MRAGQDSMVSRTHMEPVTHFLTGACIGRAGLNRKTAYATLAAVLAAEAADMDVLWSFAGPVEELKHHRGITHTFIAVPVVAAVVVGLVWLLHRWRERIRGVRPVDPNLTSVGNGRFRRNGETSSEAKAGSFSGLMYGLKPDPSRLRQPLSQCSGALGLALFDGADCRAEPSAAGLDEQLWVAAIFPLQSALVCGELCFYCRAGAVGAVLSGAGCAVAAGAGGCGDWRAAKDLSRAGMGDLCAGRHGAAVGLAMDGAGAGAGDGRKYAGSRCSGEARGTGALPVNPFRWHAILETADFYQTAEIDTRTGEIVSDPQQDVIYKPPTTAATEAAKRTLLGQVYLDWGTWAVVRDVGQEPVAGMEPPQLAPKRTWTTVEFTDLRFAYSFLGTGRASGRQPAERMGLYRGRARRCGRGDGRTGAAVRLVLLQMEIFVGLVKRFRLTRRRVDRRMKTGSSACRSASPQL